MERAGCRSPWAFTGVVEVSVPNVVRLRHIEHRADWSTAFGGAHGATLSEHLFDFTVGFDRPSLRHTTVTKP
jgi:hypothetical protein